MACGSEHVNYDCFWWEPTDQSLDFCRSGSVFDLPLNGMSIECAKLLGKYSYNHLLSGIRGLGIWRGKNICAFELKYRLINLLWGGFSFLFKTNVKENNILSMKNYLFIILSVASLGADLENVLCIWRRRNHRTQRAFCTGIQKLHLRILLVYYSLKRHYASNKHHCAFSPTAVSVNV